MDQQTKVKCPNCGEVLGGYTYSEDGEEIYFEDNYMYPAFPSIVTMED
jgi:hypothetical protein